MKKIDLEPSFRRLLPALPRQEPSTKDSTAVSTFKECKRKYFYRMVLGRSKPEGEWTSVFAWGSAVHKFLEHLYAGDDVATSTQEGLKIFRAPTHRNFEFQTKERLMQTFIKLFKFYTEEKSRRNVEVIGVEQPFNVIFPDGNVVGGRFDQIIKWNGRIWLRDWKTTSKRIDWWRKALEPNDQATRYIFGMSCLQFGQDKNGYPTKVIDGVLFTAIQNMKTNEAHIEAAPSSRNLWQLKKWMDDQMHIHGEMDRCRDADIWPMNEKACFMCEYKEVCNAPSEAAMEGMLKTHFL
jgi:hypothetical protein